MARMRVGKALVKELLESEDWRERLARLDLPLKKRIGPLMSFLPVGGTLAGRAAVALGMSAAEIARVKPEEARVLLRRFMWHMNEESGNMGWGIPESMAEACAHSGLLFREFAHILLSYIWNTGQEDNFVEHATLRRSCYRAVGSLLAARPELRDKALPRLIAGLEDEDIACRGMAVWALLQTKRPDAALPALKPAAKDEREAQTIVEIFDGHTVREYTVAELMNMALERLRGAP